MTMRASHGRVTFMRPFIPKGLDGAQPSGAYSVETLVLRRGLFSRLKAKRMSTWIRICRNPGTDGVLRIVRIDSLDLAAALMRDALLAEHEGDGSRNRQWMGDEEQAGPH